MSDESTILTLLRDRERAIAAGDAEAALAALAPDIVNYDLAPPLAYRGDAARDADGLRAWFATWNGPVRVELADPDIRVEGDLAVVHGLQRMRGDKRGEGPLDIWTRLTTVLARRPEGWRIVHEHGSFPTRMDGSGLSATDLRP